MMSTYWQLGLLFSAICLLASGMFISARVHYSIKVVLATAVVALSVYAWTMAVAVLGYPVKDYPADGTIMMAAAINKKENAIYVWIREKDAPRAYMFPYSEGAGEDISQAQKKAAESHGLMVFRRGKKNGEGGEGNQHGGNSEGDANDRAGSAGKGKKGTRAQGYGAAPGFDDDSSIEVHIDVVPSLPTK